MDQWGGNCHSYGRSLGEMCVVIFRLGPEKQRQEEFQTVLAAWNYSARYKFWGKDGKYNAPGSGWQPQIAYKSRWGQIARYLLFVG